MLKIECQICKITSTLLCQCSTSWTLWVMYMYYYYTTVLHWVMYYCYPVAPFPLLAGGREKKENRFRGEWWQDYANQSFHAQGGTKRPFWTVQQGWTCLTAISDLPYSYTLILNLLHPFQTSLSRVCCTLSLIILFSLAILWFFATQCICLVVLHAVSCVVDLTEEFQLDQPVIQGRGKYFNTTFASHSWISVLLINSGPKWSV